MCTCGPYHSIIPPGPCPEHPPQALNGLCHCNGTWHPIHLPPMRFSTTTDRVEVEPAYTGRHRR